MELHLQIINRIARSWHLNITSYLKIESKCVFLTKLKFELEMKILIKMSW